MTDTKWTPGPWEPLPTDTDGPDLGVSIVGADLGGLVGAALPWPTEIDSRDYSRVEANAHLIAAAPELYEALEAVNASMGDGRFDRLLAKARGEQVSA